MNGNSKASARKRRTASSPRPSAASIASSSGLPSASRERARDTAASSSRPLSRMLVMSDSTGPVSPVRHKRCRGPRARHTPIERLIEHAHHHQDCFLASAEHVLEVLLGRHKLLTRLVARLAQRRELCGDLVGGGFLVLQQRAQVLLRLLHRGTLAVIALAAAVVVAPAAEHSAHPAAARVALRGHYFFQLGLDDLPLIVRGAHLVLDHVGEALAHLRGVEISAVAAISATVPTAIAT